jgi:putative DNA primase/helicase
MNARPTAISVKPDSIPAELKALKAWVLWRYEWVETKWTKVPFQVGGASKARSTDPATWGIYQDALRRYQRGGFDGIGFVLDPQIGIAGIDLDHCLGESTAVWAIKIMLQLDSYTEVSPSGTGLRILVKAELPPGGRKKDSIEMYDRARYLTITGHHRIGTPQTIEQRQEALAALHTRVFAQEAKPQPKRIYSDARTQLADNDLLEKAFRARNGEKIRALYAGKYDHESQSQADMALCSALSFYSDDAAQIDRLFRSSSLYRDKWDERHFADGRTYGEATVEKSLRRIKGAA